MSSRDGGLVPQDLVPQDRSLVAVDLPGALATPVGLTLPPGLTEEQWTAAGAILVRAKSRVQWYLGDWLNYGEAAGYIDRKRYDTAAAVTGYGRSTLYDLAWVARTIESSRRHEDLSWGHHRDVASCSVGDGDAWLREAAAQRWSRAQLREAVSEASQLPLALPEPGPKTPPEWRVLLYTLKLAGRVQADEAEMKLRWERCLGSLLSTDLSPETILPEEKIEEVDALVQRHLGMFTRRLDQVTAFANSFPSSEWAAVPDDTRALFAKLVEIVTRRPPFLENA
jgi:hypothetical protein